MKCFYLLTLILISGNCNAMDKGNLHPLAQNNPLTKMMYEAAKLQRGEELNKQAEDNWALLQQRKQKQDEDLIQETFEKLAEEPKDQDNNN